MRIKSLLVIGLLLSIVPHTLGQTIVVRVGAFPNITHPEAMVGKAMGGSTKPWGPTSELSQVIAVMILIIAIGYVVDGLIFRTFERRPQYKWGFAPAT